MRTPILTESMKKLRLDPNAPFPHELASIEVQATDLRDSIKLWRQSQELKVIRNDDRDRREA